MIPDNQFIHSIFKPVCPCIQTGIKKSGGLSPPDFQLKGLKEYCVYPQLCLYFYSTTGKLEKRGTLDFFGLPSSVFQPITKREFSYW